jgi:hypothetical protein
MDLALLLIFIASQTFWIGRLIYVEGRFIPGRPRRVWLAILTVVVYLFVFFYSYSEWGLSHSHMGRRLSAAEHAYLRSILVVVHPSRSVIPPKPKSGQTRIVIVIA